MSIDSGVIVGIAVGGATGFVTCIALFVWAVCRWKYDKTKLRQRVCEEQGTTKTQDLPFPQAGLITRASYVPTGDVSGSLSLDEELTHPAHRVRDSTAPSRSQTSPPKDLQKKVGKPTDRQLHSEKNLTMRTLQASHLSAILESPTLSRSSRSNSRVRPARPASQSRSPENKSKPRQLKKQLSKANKRTAPLESLPSEVKSSDSLRPEPLFGGPRLPGFRKSVLTEGHIGILTEKSFSEPSLFNTVHEDPFCSQSSLQPLRSSRHSRSTSILNQQSSTAPSAPVPPLPPSRSLHAPVAERPFSPTSISSVDTYSSAILGAESQLTAREDFSQRNHGMDLIPRLRPLEPNHVRDELVLGSRPASRQDELPKVAGTASQQSSQQPVCISASASKIEDFNDGRISHTSNRSGALDIVQKTKPKIVLSNSARPKRKRRSLTQKASATGSPTPRKGKEATIVQKALSTMAPSREMSENSIQSSSSVEGAGQSSQYEDVIVEKAVKSLDVEGSSNAWTKRHRRSNTVCTEPKPALCGLDTRSTSDSRMANILEESASPGQTMDSAITDASFVSQPLRPLDSREGSKPSLMSSSPTLSPRTCRRASCRVHLRMAGGAPSSPTMRISRISTSSSTLLKNFPETPGKNDAAQIHDTGLQYNGSLQSLPLKRKYEEPEFVPPGLDLAKLTVSNQQAPAHQSKLANSRENTVQERTIDSARSNLQDITRYAQPMPRPAASSISWAILSPSPKSSPTTGVCNLTSTSPPLPMRQAPLSSTVNPFNTKMKLPPPYTTSPPVIFTPSSPGSSPIPPSRPRPSPGQTVLEQARELRRSRLLQKSRGSTDTIDGLEGSECGSPSQEQLWSMRMGEASPPPTLADDRHDSTIPQFRVTPAVRKTSVYDREEVSVEATASILENRTNRFGGIWDSRDCVT